MITQTLDEETIALRIRQAGQMDLVPFRSWALDRYRPILALLEHIDDARAVASPGPGLTPVLDTLRHLVPLRRRVARICLALEHGQAVDIDGHSSIAKLPSMDWAMMALEASQDELSEVVDSLWPMTDLDLRSSAYGIGPYNVKEWLSWQRYHDEEHLAELEQAIHGLNHQAKAG